MTSKEFDSPLLRELRKNVPNMNGFNATQTFDYFASVMPPEEVVKYRRVILTGCGDSIKNKRRTVVRRLFLPKASASGIY